MGLFEIIDPRSVFGNNERFPHIDRLIQTFPDSALADIGLASRHAVSIALQSPAFYVGALGSKATPGKRVTCRSWEQRTQ